MASANEVIRLVGKACLVASLPFLACAIGAAKPASAAGTPGSLVPPACHIAATPSTFTKVLGSAACGCGVDLADGTYGGNFTVRQICSASKPLLIKSVHFGAAKFSGIFEMAGTYGILQGIVVNGGRIAIGGNYNRVTRNLLRNYKGNGGEDGAITTHGGASYNRIDHNEITGQHANGIQIKLVHAGGKNTKGNQIDSNYIHDNDHAPLANGGEAIQIGQATSSTFWNVATVVAGNLIDRIYYSGNSENEVISLKSAGNTLTDNTISNAIGMYVSFRHGANNKLINNTIIGTDIRIRGKNHQVTCNNIITGTLSLMGGTCTQDQLYANYLANPKSNRTEWPAADHVMVAGNTVQSGKIVLGNSGSIYQANNITVGSNHASVQIVRASATRYTSDTGGSCSAIALKPTDVGTGAADDFQSGVGLASAQR